MADTDCPNIKSLVISFAKALPYEELDFDVRIQRLDDKIDSIAKVAFNVILLTTFVLLIFLLIESLFGEFDTTVVKVFFACLIIYALCIVGDFLVSLKPMDERYAIAEEKAKSRLERKEVATVSINRQHVSFIDFQGYGSYGHFLYIVNKVLADDDDKTQKASQFLSDLIEVEKQITPQSDVVRTNKRKMEILENITLAVKGFVR